MVPDMPIQPVALATVAQTVVGLAVGTETPEHPVDRRSRPRALIDMVAQLARRHRLDIEIVPRSVDKAVRDGALLPDASATPARPDLQRMARTRHRF